MKKAIILHGISKDKEFVAEHDLPVTTWHWLGWLQQKFNLANVSCQNPLLPHSWFPDKKYEDDTEVFSQFKVDEDTQLIGWSMGTTFLFRWLYEHPELKAKHLVLLAPHLNPNKILPDGYFDNQIPMDLMDRFERVDMFYSTDDPVPGIVESAERLMELFPNINVHKFEKHGHFQMQAMGTREFPELWEVCEAMI
jgi:pimeloyl-ACP methyl ester carboxylesterase